jgi:ATP-dependent exoDNAse (exonuclease V) alpha subunit
MIERINQAMGRFEPIGRQNQFVTSDRLNQEQKAAIDFVLKSRDGAVNISGAAGTGKTATLQELDRGLREAGREVLAMAPTVSAVEELQKGGFSEAITIERFLQDQSVQANASGKVLIVDEAGMVSGRQMSELLRIAEERSARIVFSGDTKQIRSVEACDALRVLEKESQLKTMGLTDVRRQTVHQYREAIQELRRNPELGFGQRCLP